jgi:hypothetical protein
MRLNNPWLRQTKRKYLVRARGIIFSKNITHNPFYLFFPANRRPPLKKYTKIKKNKRRPPPPPKKEKKYTNIYLIN